LTMLSLAKRSISNAVNRIQEDFGSISNETPPIFKFSADFLSLPGESWFNNLIR
jgi:hypothetical protein